MKRLSRWLACVFAGLVLFPSEGSTQAPYYAGKTITVIEGNREELTFGSPISRQVKRHRHSCENVFLFPFSTLAECVIPD